MKTGKHSKIEKRSSGMPYGRGAGSKTIQEHRPARYAQRGRNAGFSF